MLAEVHKVTKIFVFLRQSNLLLLCSGYRDLVREWSGTFSKKVYPLRVRCNLSKSIFPTQMSEVSSDKQCVSLDAQTACNLVSKLSLFPSPRYVLPLCASEFDQGLRMSTVDEIQ